MKLDDLQPGDKVKTDVGFTCLPSGAVHVVEKDEDGLFIRCICGQHYLDGQVDETTGNLIGLSHAT